MKPELVVIKGPHRGTTVEITIGTEIYIGRSHSAQLRLKSDKKVSQLHAKLLPVGEDRFILEDLGSTNGTFVNNERIEQTPVRNGDRIKIGHSLLVYKTDAAEIRPEDVPMSGSSSWSDEESEYEAGAAARVGLVARLCTEMQRCDSCGAVAPAVLEALSMAIGATRAVCMLSDPMTGQLQQLAVHRSAPPDAPEPLPPEQRLLTRAAQERRYVIDAELPSTPAVVPLRNGAATVGALYFDNPESGRRPPPDEAAMLEAVAATFSINLVRERQRRVANAACETLELLPFAGDSANTDLAPILSLCVEIYAELARARGVQVHSEPTNGLFVRADELLLNRALERLIEHVISVARDAVQIAARNSPDSGVVQISVSYTGRGFDQTGLAHVFHADGVGKDMTFALDHGLDGSLVLCRAAFELAGGAISISSRGPEQGATFLVSLPAGSPSGLPLSSPMSGSGERSRRSTTERYL